MILVVFLPLFPLLFLMILITPGSAIYRQNRIGANGHPFTILKFRTMSQHAERDGVPLWAADRDARVTAIGRVLRRSRLDELPQIWNVLRGDMSIVGPRPERPEFVSMLETEVPFWSRRDLLKPGITGWAQVRGGYASDALETEEKLAYDLWYLRHCSLLVDTVICMLDAPAHPLGPRRALAREAAQRCRAAGVLGFLNSSATGIVDPWTASFADSRTVTIRPVAETTCCESDSCRAVESLTAGVADPDADEDHVGGRSQDQRIGDVGRRGVDDDDVGLVAQRIERLHDALRVQLVDLAQVPERRQDEPQVGVARCVARDLAEVSLDEGRHGIRLAAAPRRRSSRSSGAESLRRRAARVSSAPRV